MHGIQSNRRISKTIGKGLKTYTEDIGEVRVRLKAKDNPRAVDRTDINTRKKRQIQDMFI